MIRRRATATSLCCLFSLLLSLIACDQGRPDKLDGINDIPQPFIWPEAGDVLPADLKPSGDDRCTGATGLTFKAGKTTIKGTTAGAVNEYGDGIRCGETTSLAGPQRYYRVPMKAGLTYRFVLKPQFDAAIYLFSQCGKTIINVECGSGGAIGDLTTGISAGSSGEIAFVAPAAGTYLVAVDSASASAGGAFELTVEELSIVSNASCNGAKPLAPSAGKIVVKGSTLGATNEFSTLISCGLGGTIDGPQLYYSLSLTAGTWYRVDLEPEFTATLYLFNSAGKCSATNIDLDCAGITGTVLPVVPSGSKGSAAFTPPQSGKYIVAVDSLDPKQAGDFELIIQSFTPPGNMICSAASPLIMTGGKAAVTGSTSAFLNDLGAHVSCGKSTPLIGPQAYYSVQLGAATYQLLFRPSFPSTLAVGASCMTLPVDCGTSGLTGDLLVASPNVYSSLLFTSPGAGTYTIAVDGNSSGAAGSFDLQVQTFSKPQNGSCGTPASLALASSPEITLGDTGALVNDLSGITCGNPQGPWPGPQAYYKVSLTKGKTYKIQVEPEATFDPALYAFVAGGCTAAQVNSACKGRSSDLVGAGVTETLSLTPEISGDHLIVVDSWSPSEVGKFSLRITWK